MIERTDYNMQVFNTDALLNGHNLIIGDGKGKNRVVRDLINKHNSRNGVLVVLDYDGRLYESYNGKAMLADFASSESVFPNLLETLLHSRRYGGDQKTFAAMAQKLHAHTKPDKNNNDAFWSTMGTAAFKSYVEYLCAVYKIERLATRYRAGEENDRRDLALYGRHAGKMMQIMSDLTICKQGRDDDDEGDSFDDPLYKLIERYVQRQYGERAKPFGSTLRNPGSSYSGTFQSILLSTLAVADSYFKLMELLEERGEKLSSLPELDMKEFVTKNSVPLFVCGTKSQPANQAFGAMALMASAVAAHDAGKNVTVVIPELERWNLYEALSYVKGESLSGLSTVVSCSDLRKLSALAGIDKRSVLSGLVESSDKLLWLYSTDVVCEELFEAGSSVKARSYRLNELGEQFASYQESGKEPEYYVLPEPEPYTRRRVRTPMSDDTDTSWIDRVGAEEQEEIETLLFNGLPEDLYLEMEALGYTDADDADFETDRGIGRNVRRGTKPTYAVKVLCKFLMDDKKRLTRKERRIGYSMRDGKYMLPRTLAGYDLKLLIKRCRSVLKREAELKKRNTSPDTDGRNGSSEDSGEAADGMGSANSGDTDKAKEENTDESKKRYE
ncbi:hypothetical protein [uncultured Cloacibacillus sp.]|uniref:hypothetical protein n=1 Tax=uncultured Cloacibacillus sp. TaxID=889794 RepID=UPI002627818C|nr:hypothetical protein [uncultured Cloacibacillus sp.]